MGVDRIAIRDLGDAMAPDLAATLLQSEGVEGFDCLSARTVRWLGGLRAQLPARFWVHRDRAAHVAARQVGAAAFVLGDRVFLAELPADRIDAVLRHELVHLAQVSLARRTGVVAPPALAEREALAIADLPLARSVAHGAGLHEIHRIAWFIAIGIGGYLLLRPSVANAPGPGDRIEASPSTAEIMGEAICLFAIPGGAFALGGRLGLGFLGRAALAGAGTNVGLRVVDDAARGSVSHPLLYVFDATTGAVIGFVVPGGFRLIGRAGTLGLDRLATYGVTSSDIALTRVLAEQAARAPLTAVDAQRLLQSRGMFTQASRWWLERRGLVVIYRGQEQATQQILSPLAREQGVAASEALVSRLRSLQLPDSEIAGYTARWHTTPVPGFDAPPGLAWQPLGSVGIPATGIPGIAANFGRQGVIYIIRIPKSAAIAPRGWQGLALENEYVILNQVPEGSIVQVIPASRVAPLLVNENALLVPGGR